MKKTNNKKTNNKKNTVLIFVLGIILMTVSLPAFAATYYQTGFEASETNDYTLGPINAQPSEAFYQWLAPYYDSEVTNSFIYEGSQSCYIGGDNTNARINWGGTTSYNKYIHVMYRPESTV